MDTPGTNTTAPSIDDNFDGYGDEEEEEEEGGEKDDVIRLEIGGENEEEKAKRIALAMRKYVIPLGLSEVTLISRKPMTSKDRAIRLEGHKLHVVSLLASARIRNRWASDGLLKVRLTLEQADIRLDSYPFYPIHYKSNL
jgi:xeroderma pigmentosum group C-complementing protein